MSLHQSYISITRVLVTILQLDFLFIHSFIYKKYMGFFLKAKHLCFGDKFYTRDEKSIQCDYSSWKTLSKSECFVRRCAHCHHFQSNGDRK